MKNKIDFDKIANEVLEFYKNKPHETDEDKLIFAVQEAAVEISRAMLMKYHVALLQELTSEEK